ELERAVPSGVPRTIRDDWIFEEDVCGPELLRVYALQSLDGLGFQSDDTALVRAAGSLIQYLGEIRPAGVTHLQPVRIQRPGRVMLLDEMTRRNLELIEPMRGGEEGGTLLDVLDDTVTAMGGRLLRRWVLEPLVVPEEIWARQSAVTELVEAPELNQRLRDALSGVHDLERLAGKFGTLRVAPRGRMSLRRSL
ncbi:MAG: DNA mismatch repair protein MutS, partial [Gemmatimonadota bacterium]|nr:DNA mismatch repair protein MutS [Gemmatimonadota bacterium]